MIAGCATGGQTAASSSRSGADKNRGALQVTGPMHGSPEPTTDAVILGRLERTAGEIPPQMQVPRIALADLAYPASQEELRALGGFALLLVTVVCHDAEELPVDRVEAHVGTAVAALPVVTSRRSELGDARLAGIFGRARYDAAYLLPVFTTRQNAKIVVYVGSGRFPLAVLQFPPPPDADELPADLEFNWDPYEPKIDALRALLDRELPVLAGSPLTGH